MSGAAAVDSDPVALTVPARLSWGLLIATKDRIEELATCVELALAQTRPPAEVVVVDASAAWEAHRERIGVLVAAHPEIRFVYLQAETPSLTVQRNQALAEAHADIAFMIDDDSFMFPDCAEEVMRVYEADATGAIAGVQISLSPTIPGDRKIAAKPKSHNYAGLQARLKTTRLFHAIFLPGMRDFFIPYDGRYPELPAPAEVADLAVKTTRLFEGARMTYRRAAAAAAGFDPILRYYCPFEDQDASYRISRGGALMTAARARLHHFASAGGRIERYRVTYLGMLNQAVLLRRHAPDVAAARRRYFALMRRRIFAELLKDVLGRRFGLPQCRGAIAARRTARQVFPMTIPELEAWYPGMQERILKG